MFKNSKQRKAAFARMFHMRKGIPTPPPEWMSKEADDKMLSPAETMQKIRWEKKNKSFWGFKSADDIRLKKEARKLCAEIAAEKRRMKK